MTKIACRSALAAVLAIVLGACGSSATQTKQPRSVPGAEEVAPDAADAYLQRVMTGEVKGPAVLGDKGSLVIFGGYRGLKGSDSGSYPIELSRMVVVLHGDGTRSAFEIGEPMVDVADAAMIDGSLYVVGRTCDSNPISTDTGITCTPGAFRVERIDVTGRSATSASVKGLAADTSGATSAAMLELGGKPVVLTSTRELGPRFLPLTADLGGDGTIPAPKTGEVCSTGAEFIQLNVTPPRISGSHGPGDPLPTMAPAPAPVVLRQFTNGAKTWADSAKSPVVDYRYGISMTCSKGRVTVLATGADNARTLLVYDTSNDNWTQTPATLDVSFTAVTSAPSMTPILIMNPANADVIFDPASPSQKPTKVAGGPVSERSIVAALGDGTFGQLGTDLKLHVLT